MYLFTKSKHEMNGFSVCMICIATVVCSHYVLYEFHDMFLIDIVSAFIYRCIVGNTGIMISGVVKNMQMQTFIIVYSCTSLIINVLQHWNNIDRNVKFMGSCAILIILIYIIMNKISH